MFAVIFSLAFVAAHVAAQIPSYIHVCGRKDPNIDQCILNNVNNLKSKFCKGLPELELDSIEPLRLDKLSLSDTPESKMYIENTEITGLCDYKTGPFHFDPEKNHFDIEVTFRQIRINTTYTIELHILVPIHASGALYTTTDNVDAKVSVDMKVATKGDKRYLYLSRMKTDLDLKGYEATFDVSNHHGQQFREVFAHFLGTNQQEIIRTLKPLIEQVVSKQVIGLSNSLLTHFTYEEIFPDRT